MASMDISILEQPGKLPYKKFLNPLRVLFDHTPDPGHSIESSSMRHFCFQTYETSNIRIQLYPL